jgi:ABC-type microcin C transport system permease subunit YejB
MNKSLLTNIISIVLIIIGYLTPVFLVEIKSMVLYSFSGAITNWLTIHMLFEKVPFRYGSVIVTNALKSLRLG